MIITTTAKELIQAMKAIRPVMRKHRYLPILSCCLLEAADGVVTLGGTDLQYTIRVPLEEAKVDTNGQAAIPFLVLSEVIKTLPIDAVLTLSIEGLKMTVESGKYKGMMKLFDAGDYPVLEGKPAPPMALKKEKKEKVVLGGILKAYIFEARHGRSFSSRQEDMNGEWMGGRWYEILGIDQVCLFQLESDNLSPMIAKIEKDWHSLPSDSVHAYEIVGQTKKQYKQVPPEPGSWKRSTAHSWQIVEQFDYYAG